MPEMIIARLSAVPKNSSGSKLFMIFVADQMQIFGFQALVASGGGCHSCFVLFQPASIIKNLYQIKATSNEIRVARTT